MESVGQSAGRGVLGEAKATSGDTYGVWGESRLNGRPGGIRSGDCQQRRCVWRVWCQQFSRWCRGLCPG